MNQMRRPRDFAGEYARRKALIAERGFSLSQARGHPRVGESYVSGRKTPKHDQKLEAALKRLRKKGATLSGIAAEAGVGRERLSRYVKSVAGARRKGGKWLFDDKRVRRLEIITSEQWQPVKVRARGFRPSRRAGRHAYEAGQALLNQKLAPRFIRKWQGKGIRDVRGQWHTFSTDLNQIYSAVLMDDYSFEQFYRIEG